jgi:hypothetical protein
VFCPSFPCAVCWSFPLPFVHTCNHLKCRAYFCLSYIILQCVSASLGHHQVYTLLLKLFYCHLSVSHVNTLLLLILNSLKCHKTADSAALHLVVSCGRFACCCGVWISISCWVDPFCACIYYESLILAWNIMKRIKFVFVFVRIFISEEVIYEMPCRSGVVVWKKGRKRNSP